MNYWLTFILLFSGLNGFAVTHLDGDRCYTKIFNGEPVELCQTPLYGDTLGAENLTLETIPGYRTYANFSCGVSIHYLIPRDIFRKVRDESHQEFNESLTALFGIMYEKTNQPENLGWLAYTDLLSMTNREALTALKDAPRCLKTAIQKKSPNNPISNYLFGSIQAYLSFHSED
jgi:hypothetical protein